jgi:hypothetical protein
MKDISRREISDKVKATHLDYPSCQWVVEARTHFDALSPVKLSADFDAPTRLWMRIVCRKFPGSRGHIEVPSCFCDQIRTVIRATVSKRKGSVNPRILSKGHDLEQPHVDNVCGGDQVDRVTISTRYNEADWDAAAHRV